MSIRQLLIAILLCIAGSNGVKAQLAPDSSSKAASKIAAHYANTIEEKAVKASDGINKQTEIYLNKLENQEARLQRKLSSIDSVAAHNIFSDSKKQYDQARNKIKSKSASLVKKAGRYFPWADSAGTSLRFLSDTKLAGSNAPAINGALSGLKQMEKAFAQAGSIKEFIKQRKAYLSEQLKNYDLGNELKKYNVTAYYYSQQVNEYREMLKDPEKIERKTLKLLSKSALFSNFFKNNSQLASLFNLPGSNTNPAAVSGLQTNAQINSLIQQQIASGGAGAQQQFQQNMQAAQGELQQLKNKLNQLGAGGSAEEMPSGFKPNPQRTKTFLQRIEIGSNIQSQKVNEYFPATSNIGLSAGYKLNQRSIVGLGMSYKLGWGQDIRHIKISHQGIGLRSFIDWKIKGSFWVTGGYEMNYNAAFKHIEQLENLNAWRQSGLLGVSKQVSLKSKVFKNTKLQLLWDLLSYQQVPRTQPIVFRVGYSFN